MINYIYYFLVFNSFEKVGPLHMSKSLFFINRNKLWIILIAFFLVSVLYFNIKSYFYTCISATDFSIYQEAIYKMANFESLNPYVIVRDIKIFNDHFDPIIILAAPVVRLFSYHPTSLLFFQMFWVVLSLILIYRFKRADSSDGEIIFSLLLLIFSRGLVGGLVFPIHPVTWSVFALLWLLVSIYRKRDNSVIVASIFLLSFKEIYCFSVLSLSFYYLLKKNKKVFLWLSIPAISYIYFLFCLRADLLGPVHPYSKRVLDPLFAALFAFLIDRIRHFDYKELIELHYAIILPLILLIRVEVRKVGLSQHNLLPTLFLLLPLYGVHGLSNIFFNWNGVPFSVIWCGLFIFSSLPKIALEKKSLGVLILIFFITSSSKHYAKAVKLAYFERSKTCEISASKLASITSVREHLNKEGGRIAILSTTGFIPWSLKPNRDIYLAGSYSVERHNYDFLVMERNHTGFISPYSDARIEEIISKCTTGVIQSDQYVFFAHGPFERECLEGFRQFQ